MAIIRPFRGVRYNIEKVLLKKVIAPPYDVISERYREILLTKSPENVVRIDLPEGEDKYNDAARLYQRWRDDGMLIKQDEPSIYVYEQEYDFGGKHYIRSGIVALVKLEEFGTGAIFPHEKTMSAPKKDRLDLMLACKANFSMIFGLYNDAERGIDSIIASSKQGMPIQSAMDDENVKHTMWGISSPEVIEAIQNHMKSRAVYIADGHHRYETALTYRNMMREQHKDEPNEVKPYDFVMMMLVNFYDPGLMIFSTHRVVDLPAGLEAEKLLSLISNDYTVTKYESETLEDFENKKPYNGNFLMITADAKYDISLKEEFLEPMHPVLRNIDTYILEHNILSKHMNMTDASIAAKEGLHFYQNLQDVEEYIKAHPDSVGFVLHKTSADNVRLVSENGMVMPQKSTYFYPKLASGLLINEL